MLKVKKLGNTTGQESNLGLLTRGQGFLNKGSVFLPFHSVAYLRKVLIQIYYTRILHMINV